MGVAEMLRAEADACRETASGPCGEYGNAFWVAAIVLEKLAKRLEAADTPSPITATDTGRNT